MQTVFADSHTMVAHIDFGKLILHSDEDVDRTAFVAELDGIADEVSDNGFQHILISTHHDGRCSHIQLQFDMLGFCNHHKDIHHSGHHLCQVKILEHHIQSARLALGPLQQVVEQVMGFF